MRKTFRITTFLCCIMIIMILLCGCSPEASAIRKTLNEFQSAAQSLDAEGMLDCVDPSVATPIGGAIGALSALTGTETQEILPAILKTVFGEDVDGSTVMEHISVDHPKLRVSGDEAQVECELHITTEDSSYTRKTTIQMKKIDDKWYIAGVGAKE